jgi:two-component system catabolic regulation response regulator CreB
VKPRILIVEDEPGIADTLQYALRTEGFEPVWVATGEAALEQVQSHAPALVILDVGLPDTSGFEVFKRLRELAPDLPVIFLTARSDEIDRVVGLELGADDYVPKPFSPRELVARVRSILRRSAKAPAAPPQPPALPLSVDEGKRQIRFYGALLELSRYEFGLLQTLASRPGHVFSRDALLQRVWDDATESLDRTVDAHVKTLRAKMKTVAPTLEPIRTHRGTGYALAEDLPATMPT